MVSAQTKTIEQKIEEAILAQNLPVLTRLLNAHVRNANGDNETLLYAALYFRRVGEYKKALNLLQVKLKPITWDRISDLSFRCQIQAVQLLSFLGSGTLSVALLQCVSASRRKQVLSVMAMTYIQLRDFARARECLEELLASAQGADNHLTRYAKLCLGLCYAYLDEPKLAAQILTEAQKLSADPTFQRCYHLHLLVSQGMGGKPEEAVKTAEASLRLYTPDDDGPTIGTVLEHYGRALVLLGRYDEATTLLDEAFKRIYQPGSAPSTWLGILYWQGLIQFEKNKAKKDFFPEEWARFLVYPAQAWKQYRELIAEKTAIPRILLMNREGRASQFSRKVHYNLSSETKVVHRGDASETRKVGFHLVDRAIIALVLSGSHGIPEYALYSYLWPKDYAVDQCHRRIAQIIKRIRALGHSVEWKSGHICFDRQVDISCEISNEHSIRGADFLKEKSHFKRQDVQQFFSLSKSHALNLCAQWLQEGVVVRTKEKSYRTTKKFEFAS